MMNKYLGNEGNGWECPDRLRYQFSDDFKLKVSQFCCLEMKKKPFKKWMKENHRTITMTGMMKEEGGQRTTLDCIHFTKGKVTRFHPLAKVSHEWEKWFIDEYKIPLCKLYYDPFNFERCGCKGCPYSTNLAEQLTLMDRYGLGNERKQCEIIWKPVYDEYRRIGYRLTNEEQTKLF